MSDTNKDQEIQSAAEQLSRRFSEMRLQMQRNRVPETRSDSQAISADIRSHGASVTDLAKQLGTLLEEGTVMAAPSTTGPVTSPAERFESVPDPSVYERDFVNIFEHVNKSVLAFETSELLGLAFEQMPVDRLYEEAEAMAKDHPEDSRDDIVIRSVHYGQPYLNAYRHDLNGKSAANISLLPFTTARRLLHWFKNEYFTWLNEPPCVVCEAKTMAIGVVVPTEQERLDGAGTVEVYRCTQTCTAITRFPRYGGMSKILFTTRRGRCGEWANSLSYCIAFSAEEVVDVTRRYTIEYDSVVVKRRRSIREPVFAKFLYRLSESNLARLNLDSKEIQAIRQRQDLELEELSGKNGDTRVVQTMDRESGKLVGMLRSMN
ncbi:peptide-N4-(N-acetyl-beta- glucosaminyl)asparagine amidase [Mortierella sp. GBA43]|nr:peptide-N4-(N-acetyl-beta- glucosaminyl)asparagine amidase [Mortierella sp. GBA43]